MVNNLHPMLQRRCNHAHFTDKEIEAQRVYGLLGSQLHINVYRQSPCHTALPLVGEYHIDHFFVPNSKGELYESGQKG